MSETKLRQSNIHCSIEPVSKSQSANLHITYTNNAYMLHIDNSILLCITKTYTGRLKTLTNSVSQC